MLQHRLHVLFDHSINNFEATGENIYIYIYACNEPPLFILTAHPCAEQSPLGRNKNKHEVHRRAVKAAAQEGLLDERGPEPQRDLRTQYSKVGSFKSPEAPERKSAQHGPRDMAPGLEGSAPKAIIAESRTRNERAAEGAHRVQLRG